MDEKKNNILEKKENNITKSVLIVFIHYWIFVAVANIVFGIIWSITVALRNEDILKAIGHHSIYFSVTLAVINLVAGLIGIYYAFSYISRKTVLNSEKFKKIILYFSILQFFLIMIFTADYISITTTILAYIFSISFIHKKIILNLQ